MDAFLTKFNLTVPGNLSLRNEFGSITGRWSIIYLQLFLKILTIHKQQLQL